MKEYTKGEWKQSGPVVADKRDNIFSHTAVVCGGIRIARVAGIGNENSEANADLIAAAPAMYEILKDVEAASRLRRPIKKATWLKVCDILQKVDGLYR